MRPAQAARAVWSAAEPWAVGTYFSPEVGEHVTRPHGLHARNAFIVLRAAPMGAAAPAVVTAAFHSFPLARIAEALAEAQVSPPPTAAVTAMHEVVPLQAARLFAGTAAAAHVVEVADLLWSVVASMETVGRPLAAANQAMTAPTEPWGRAWRALNALRELRGDSHVAALVAADLSLMEAERVMAAWAGERVDTTMLRTSRRMDDVLWESGVPSLVARGFLTTDGTLTDAGRAMRDQVEAQTDAASAAPFEVLGVDGCRQVWEFCAELGHVLVAAREFPAVTAVGAPWPPLPLPLPG